ncbi:DUF4393 domain-containing protein [Fibrella forsythiae]|uniref:DUF4393 domain-containing protein n=1 Tax=Fibrella forsythiae TaxID=2817061 RepID=A0ABS3JC01_9BACT|nr:DUF4393 domain-containing protein [Fibrella forsythiae]MBO0947505.1 DUF4393 domain-containing protein [Fibrella forsythiae]
MEGGLNQLARSIASSVELLPLVYKDLAQPSVQKAGKALETVVGLGNTALLPILLLNEKTNYWFTKHMENYKVKLDTIPAEKVCPVPPELGVPLLEKLTYTTNDDLADLFTTLLAKASSIETANEAHPKFVSIISLLSADEAKIIKHIKDDLIYTNLLLYLKDDEGYFEISSYLTSLVEELDFIFPDNDRVYLQNLITLGILSDAYPSKKINPEKYEKLHNFYRLYPEEGKKILGDRFGKTEWVDSHFKLTDLGRLFIKSCNIL